MDKRTELLAISLIQDNKQRKEAALEWYNSLSDKEKQEFHRDFNEAISQLTGAFSKIGKVLVDALTPAINAIQEFSENPQVKEYLESLED